MNPAMVHEGMHSPATKATELLGTQRSPAEPCRTPVPWMLWWIVGVHTCWGLGLLFKPAILNTVVVLIGVDWITDLGLDARYLGAILLVFSCMAAAGLVLERIFEAAAPRHAVWFIGLLILPQYFVVLAAFVSDVNTMLDGAIDGHAVERWLLLGALAPVLWGALLHTAAILERYTLIWRRR